MAAAPRRRPDLYESGHASRHAPLPRAAPPTRGTPAEASRLLPGAAIPLLGNIMSVAATRLLTESTPFAPRVAERPSLCSPSGGLLRLRPPGPTIPATAPHVQFVARWLESRARQPPPLVAAPPPPSSPRRFFPPLLSWNSRSTGKNRRAILIDAFSGPSAAAAICRRRSGSGENAGIDPSAAERKKNEATGSRTTHDLEAGKVLTPGKTQ